MNTLLKYRLIKTTKRLTFDIIEQAHNVTYFGDDDGPYFKFVATNGYEVISRSRMDIQTERIWLLGAKNSTDPRSGTMVFSDDDKRDAAYVKFTDALNEWAAYNNGIAVNIDDQYTQFDQMKDLIQCVSIVSHCGGLVDMSEADALKCIRLLTRSSWDNTIPAGQAIARLNKLLTLVKHQL